MAENMGRSIFRLGAGAFFLAFMVFPLAMLLFNLQLFPLPANLILRNLFQASLSAALAILLGLPLSYALLHKTPFSRLLNSLSLVPLVLPQPVMILSLVLLFGNNGLFDLPFSLYGIEGIVLAHMLYNFPLAAKIISSGWARVSNLEPVGRVLGADPFRAFLFVTLPSLRNPIASAFAVVFAFSFTSFSIPLVFGGIANSTIEVEIFRTFFRDFNFQKGAFLALLQIMAFLPLAAFWSGFRWELFPKKESGSKIADALSLIYLAIFSLILLPPLCHMKLFDSSLSPIFNSIYLGAISAILCVILWLLVGRKFSHQSFLLFGISPAVLAVSYFFLPYTFWLLPIGHAILSFALVSSILLPFSDSLDKYEAAASGLGADGLQNFRHIYLPLMVRPLLLAFSFSFAFSLGETAFLTSLSQGFPTMSTVLLQAFSSYRFAEGYFYSALLILIAMIFAFLMEGLHIFSHEARGA
ncbi:MAG: ABC transporter permease subunit [Candidatus Micrarchaeota archaeon]